MKYLLPIITLTAALIAPAAAAPSPVSAPKLVPVLARAKSYSVTETAFQPNTRGTLTKFAVVNILFGQGGKYYVDMQRHAEHIVAISDGKRSFQYLPAQKQYRKAHGELAAGQSQLETLPSVTPTRTMLDGRPALLFQQFQPSAGKPSFVTKIWTDAKTYLIQRVSSIDLSGKTPKVIEQSIFSHWKINPVVPASRFAFVPPAGAKEVVAKAPPAELPLLANGTAAPDFAAVDKSGKPVHLSDYKGKVVVLDFWATWCGPCQQSLPHTESVAAQFASQGVVVLAVNVWDKHDAFEQWLPQHASFKDIAFVFDPSDGSMAVTKAYNVSGIPTQYVVGKDGKIAQSFVGYDGPTDSLANALTVALKG